MVLVSRTGRIIGVRKLALVPGSWHARNLYVSGESPLGQRGSSSFRLHVHRDLTANTIIASLIHHARPAAVYLYENCNKIPLLLENRISDGGRVAPKNEPESQRPGGHRRGGQQCGGPLLLGTSQDRD